MTAGDVEEKLKVHVHTLAHRIGERNLAHYDALGKARDYIIEAFESCDLETRTEEYNVWNKAFQNVVAVKKGTDPEMPALVIGAHYDTAEGTPGADDNASGTAGVLELARLLGKERLRRTLIFVAFGTEEPPYFGTDLMGSRFFAKGVRERGAKIEGMICLEMLGYFRNEHGSQHYPSALLQPFFPDKGNFISVVGNFRSRALVKQVAAGLRRNSVVPVENATLPAFIPGVDWSDHRSFWAEGFKAVMLTDTALYRNPNYHQKTDTYNTLDYKTMTGLVLGISETIKGMAR